MHLPAGPSALNALPQPALLQPSVILQSQAQKFPLSNTCSPITPHAIDVIIELKLGNRTPTEEVNFFKELMTKC